MSRRQAREVALLTLFQLEFNPCEGQNDEQLKEHELIAFEYSLTEVVKLASKDGAYAKKLVSGVLHNKDSIDTCIEDKAKGENGKGWKIDRMPAIDRNLLRIALYEMRYQDEKIEPAIAINEAVDLAKKYGTDASGRYVNGILGSL